MPIRKFNVKVTREDEYEIAIDDEIYTREWMDEFGKYMWKLDDIQDIAKAIAWHQMRNGDERFLEGLGNITRDGELPFSHRDFDGNGNLSPEDKRDKAAPGLDINAFYEDEEYEIIIEEVNAREEPES